MPISNPIGNMSRKTRFHIGYWVAAIVGFLILQYFYVSAQKVASIPYSQFEQLLHEHKVSEVGVSDRYLQGKLKEPLPNGKSEFVTTRVDPQFADELQKYGVTYTGEVGSTLLQDLLSWILPVLLFLGVWMFLSRRFTQGLGGGLMSIGKSKAKIYVESDTGVRFDDVAGVDEAKEELQEIVEFLKNPEQYSRLGGRMPKGILLVGPPGTGKTLLAKAVAGQAKVPFFSISGSEFVEMFVGVGAARVRDLFEQARTKAPAIIFIDELDALGRARGFGAYGGHDEKEQTLNQLLVEMDGFDARSGLVILAATNRPEILDPALLRAGRFDRQVLVDRPDKKGRVDILRVHLRQTKLASDVDPEKIAALTPGFTGADLANLVNEATLLATRRGGDAVTMADFTNAVERMVAGLETRRAARSPPPTVLMRDKCHRLSAPAAIHHPARRPYPRAAQVWRLLVHWQAHLPKRARKQGAVRLCEALLVSFGSPTAKRAGAWDQCHRQTPKKTLRLRKSEPRNRRNDLLHHQGHPPLSRLGWGRIDPRRQCFALEPTARSPLHGEIRRRSALSAASNAQSIAGG